MTLFQYLPFIMIALLIASIISSLFLKKKDLPVELFVEGLRYENDGHFDEAIMNYENALNEVKKNSPRKTGTAGQNQRHKKSLMCNLYISTFDLSLVEMGD